MKYLATILTLILATGAAYAESAMSNDPIIIITPEGNNKSVTYTDKESSYEINSSTGTASYTSITNNYERKDESDFNFYFPFKPSTKNKKHSDSYPKNSLSVGNMLMIGFVGVANSHNPCKFNMGRSIEISAPTLVALNCKTSQRGPTITLGFGLGWKNFHSQNGVLLKKEILDEEEILDITKFPSGAYRKSSHIHMFSLMIPLIIKQKVGNKLQLGLGAALDFNTHMCAKTRYTLDGVETKENWDPAARRPISYDILFTINYGHIGWYVKYSPLSAFKTGAAPNTTAISTGLVLGK
ncbi:MAG: hypothetical protein K2J74_03625 [Muribaculaceae bacterium]|nr:hypothetical protein [Muribaculaceae bacterium]